MDFSNLLKHINEGQRQEAFKDWLKDAKNLTRDAFEQLSVQKQQNLMAEFEQSSKYEKPNESNCFHCGEPIVDISTAKSMEFPGLNRTKSMKYFHPDCWEVGDDDPDTQLESRNTPLKVGMKVKVSGGSGIDSDKVGVIVNRDEVKTDGRSVPTNVEGSYKPVDWSKEMAVKLEDGSLITMFKNRLIPVSENQLDPKYIDDQEQVMDVLPVSTWKKGPKKTNACQKCGTEELRGDRNYCFKCAQGMRNESKDAIRCPSCEYILPNTMTVDIQTKGTMKCPGCKGSLSVNDILGDVKESVNETANQELRKWQKALKKAEDEFEKRRDRGTDYGARTQWLQDRIEYCKDKVVDAEDKVRAEDKNESRVNEIKASMQHRLISYIKKEYLSKLSKKEIVAGNFDSSHMAKSLVDLYDVSEEDAEDIVQIAADEIAESVNETDMADEKGFHLGALIVYKNALDTLKKNLGITDEPMEKSFLVFQEGTSNKYHLFAMFKKGNDYTAANAYGRIGSFMRYSYIATGDSYTVRDAYSNKVRSKIRKGYKEVPANVYEGKLNEALIIQSTATVDLIDYEQLKPEEKKEVSPAVSGTFFRFDGHCFDLGEFERVDPNGELAKQGWEGTSAPMTAWSAYVIKQIDEVNNKVTVAYAYFSDTRESKMNEADEQCRYCKELTNRNNMIYIPSINWEGEPLGPSPAERAVRKGGKLCGRCQQIYALVNEYWKKITPLMNQLISVRGKQAYTAAGQKFKVNRYEINSKLAALRTEYSKKFMQLVPVVKTAADPATFKKISDEEYSKLSSQLSSLERGLQDAMYSGDDSSAREEQRYYRERIKSIKAALTSHDRAIRHEKKQEPAYDWVADCAGTAAQIAFEYPDWGTEHVSDMYKAVKQSNPNPGYDADTLDAATEYADQAKKNGKDYKEAERVTAQWLRTRKRNESNSFDGLMNAAINTELKEADPKYYHDTSDKEQNRSYVKIPCTKCKSLCYAGGEGGPAKSMSSLRKEFVCSACKRQGCESVGEGVRKYLPPDEAEAAGYVFGAENMGMTDDTEQAEFMESAPDWKSVISDVNSYIGSRAESDEMYDGMLDEIKAWIKIMKKAPADDYHRRAWETLKSKTGAKYSDPLRKEIQKTVDTSKMGPDDLGINKYKVTYQMPDGRESTEFVWARNEEEALTKGEKDPVDAKNRTEHPEEYGKAIKAELVQESLSTDSNALAHSMYGKDFSSLSEEDKAKVEQRLGQPQRDPRFRDKNESKTHDAYDQIKKELETEKDPEKRESLTQDKMDIESHWKDLGRDNESIGNSFHSLADSLSKSMFKESHERPMKCTKCGHKWLGGMPDLVHANEVDCPKCNSYEVELEESIKEEEMSFVDVFNQCLELENGDKRKAAEAALSLWTGGMFDAAEGERREAMIQKAMKAVETKVATPAVEGVVSNSFNGLIEHLSSVQLTETPEDIMKKLLAKRELQLALWQEKLSTAKTEDDKEMARGRIKYLETIIHQANRDHNAEMKSFAGESVNEDELTNDPADAAEVQEEPKKPIVPEPTEQPETEDNKEPDPDANVEGKKEYLGNDGDDMYYSLMTLGGKEDTPTIERVSETKWDVSWDYGSGSRSAVNDKYEIFYPMSIAAYKNQYLGVNDEDEITKMARKGYTHFIQWGEIEGDPKIAYFKSYQEALVGFKKKKQELTRDPGACKAGGKHELDPDGERCYKCGMRGKYCHESVSEDAIPCERGDFSIVKKNGVLKEDPSKYGKHAYFCKDKKGWYSKPCKHLKESRINEVKYQVVDANDQVVYPKKGQNLDTTDVAAFITDALQALQISNVSYDIVMKYIIPPAEEETKEQAPEEDLAKQPQEPDAHEDLHSQSAEDQAEKAATMNRESVSELMRKYKLYEDDMISALTKKHVLNEDFADSWQVGDYIDQLGTILEIHPKRVVFKNDQGQTSSLWRVAVPPTVAAGFKDVKRSAGKLNKVDVDKMYKTGDVEEAEGNCTCKKCGKKFMAVAPNAFDMCTSCEDQEYLKGYESVAERLKAKYGLLEDKILREANRLLEKYKLYEAPEDEEGEAEEPKLVPTDAPVEEPVVPEEPKEEEVPEPEVEEPKEEEPAGAAPTAEPVAGLEPDPSTGGGVQPLDTPTEAPPTDDPDKIAEFTKKQIMQDYPEEPYTTTALAFADSFVHDPQIYGRIRSLRWEGIYTDSDTFLKQAKIAGVFNNFNPDESKKLVDKFGESAKFKLARDGDVYVFITARDTTKQHSLEAVKDLVNADIVQQTKNPGEIMVWWS